MAEKQFKLSEKKAKWAKQFKPTGAARGTTLASPMILELRYSRGVQRILKAVVKATQEGVIEIFKTPVAKEYYAEDAASFTSTANKSLDTLFKRLSARSVVEADKLARSMVEGANVNSRSAMGASLKELSGGVTLDPSLMGGKITEIFQASVEANAGLIVNASEAYIAKVSDAVMRSIQEGRGLQDLIPFMRKQAGVSYRHGRNVALDQSRKAFNALNVARMENVGLSKFEWIHSGGGQKPRKFHKARFPLGLNGGIYDIHDPPIIDPKTGERGLPAHLPGCKCRMRIVLTFDDEGDPEP